MLFDVTILEVCARAVFNNIAGQFVESDFIYFIVASTYLVCRRRVLVFYKALSSSLYDLRIKARSNI